MDAAERFIDAELDDEPMVIHKGGLRFTGREIGVR
jgi:hypothetical protein